MDFYQELNVERNASPEEIKKAYRRLSLIHHPDRSSDPDSKLKFEHMKRAYDVLIDEKKREIYNRYGNNGVERYEADLHAREFAKIPQCAQTVVEVPVSLEQLYKHETIVVKFTVTNHDNKSTEEKSINLVLQDGMSYDHHVVAPNEGDNKTDMRNGDVLIALVRPSPDPWQEYELSNGNLKLIINLSIGDLFDTGYNRLIKHPNGKTFSLKGKFSIDDEENTYITKGLGIGGDLICIVRPNLEAIINSSKEFQDLINKTEHKKTQSSVAEKLPAITMQQYNHRFQGGGRGMRIVEGNGCVQQ
jgi:DnaJ-class molecular chaperone